MPTLADTSMSRLAYVKEVTFNTIPSAVFTKLRYTGESLVLNSEVVDSDELRDDFMKPDVVQVGVGVSGGWSVEWSYDAFTTILAGLARESFSTAQAVTGSDFTSTQSTNTIGSVAQDLSVFSPGDWVRVSGYANAATNGIKRVVTSAANAITVAGAQIGADETGITATVEHDGVLVNGNTNDDSFTFEKGYLDVTQFHAFTGCKIGSVSFNAAARQKITGDFTIMGVDEQTAASQFGSGDPTENPSTTAGNRIWDASNDLTLLHVDEIDPVVSLKEFSFSINGNLREQPAAMQKALVGVGRGRFDVEISMRIYFENFDEYAKLRSGASTALAVGVNDDAGNDMIFYFPAATCTSAQILQSGMNSDVDVEMSFSAYRDSTLGIMFSMTKIDV